MNSDPPAQCGTKSGSWQKVIEFAKKLFVCDTEILSKDV